MQFKQAHKKLKALVGDVRPTDGPSKLVGHLLTPEEVELVAGASGCGQNQSHEQGADSTYTQGAGAQYTQAEGSTYTQTCDGQQPY